MRFDINDIEKVNVTWPIFKSGWAHFTCFIITKISKVGRYLFKLMMNLLDLSSRGPTIEFIYILCTYIYKTNLFSRVSTRASIYTDFLKHLPARKNNISFSIL